MKELASIDALDALISGSGEAPVILFKHSTTCPLSARAAMRVEDYLDEPVENGPEILMVKVIQSRPVSNAITDKLRVEHQSPQMILVRDGKAVWNASHSAITAAAITDAVKANLAAAK